MLLPKMDGGWGIDKWVEMTEHSSGHRKGRQKKKVVVGSKSAPEEKEGLFTYFKSSWTELKKVIWPSRDGAVKMTVFVITFAATLAAFAYTADTIISWLFFDISLNRKG